MAKKFLIYKANDRCCGPNQYHYIQSWSYVPKAGTVGGVDFVENTYWRGNGLKYIWIQADHTQIDSCGELIGDLRISLRCLDPCWLEQVVAPLTITQIGGFGLPISKTTFRGMTLGNCTGPVVLGPLPPNVQGFDVPVGNKIRVQFFGGFGMTRTVNASNKNLGGATRPIVNRRLTESANPTDGFFVPWLKDEVPGQIAAGKKMIFERKYGEGSHTFEFSANKVGATYFSVMDQASCIRYWVMNVMASHCYDWNKMKPIEGPQQSALFGNQTDSFTWEGNPNRYEMPFSANDAKSVLEFRTNFLPVGQDVSLMERYYISRNVGSDFSICDCDSESTRTAASNTDVKAESLAKTKGQNEEHAPNLYTAGTTFIQCSRNTKKYDGKIGINIPRSVHFGDGKVGPSSAFVGQEVEVPLPKSLTNGAFFGDYGRRPKVKVLEQPFLPVDPEQLRVAGAAKENTGPIGANQNDDSSFVFASPKKNSIKIHSKAPTNYLPATIEIDYANIDGSSLYAYGTVTRNENLDKYKYLAPPAPAQPVQIEIQNDGNGLHPATNNDTEETNSLKISPMVGLGAGIIPWTQRAMYMSFRSMCPSVRITIKSKPPHQADFNPDSDYWCWDYGEGTEIQLVAELPAAFDGNVSAPKFHFPISEISHKDNKYFGREGPVGSPTLGGWSNAQGGGTKFTKTYKLNSRAGLNNKDFANTNLSVYFSFQIGTFVWGANVITKYDIFGDKAPFKNDEWFEKGDSGKGIFWDKKHTPDAGAWGRVMKRNFAQEWNGLDEQLRGCNCIQRNTKDLMIVRQPPIIEDPNDGDEGKAIRFDELNANKGVGITFVEGPGQKDGDFDRLL